MKRILKKRIIISEKTIKRLFKSFTLFSAIVMFVSALPLYNFINAYAFSYEPTVKKVNEDFDLSTVPIDFEVKGKRGEYSKHFRKIDGTYEVSVYNEAVHYFKDGKWEDIDNSLLLDEKSNEYENKSNSFKIKLPKNIKENKDFKVKFEDYLISWSINDINDSDILVLENEKSNSNDLRELDNINQNVIYKDIFNNVDLEYNIIGKKIKENIILNKYQDNLSITFSFKLKKLSLDYDEEGNIVFVNENEEVVSNLQSFIMYDSNNNQSKDIDITVNEKSKKEFTLNLTPSDEWLSDSSRVYPVVVDPTIQFSSDNYPIKDKYTTQNSYNDTSQTLKVGNDGTNVNQTFLEIDLDNIVDNNKITYANLELDTSFSDSAWSNDINNQDTVINLLEVDNYTSIDQITTNITNSNEIVDYLQVKKDEINKSFYFNITNLLYKWKEENKIVGFYN